MARKQRLSNQAAVKAAAQPQSVPPVEATEHQSLRQRKPQQQQQQQQQQRKTSASTPTMADDLPKPKRSAGRPRKVPIAALPNGSPVINNKNTAKSHQTPAASTVDIELNVNQRPRRQIKHKFNLNAYTSPTVNANHSSLDDSNASTSFASLFDESSIAVTDISACETSDSPSLPTTSAPLEIVVKRKRGRPKKIQSIAVQATTPAVPTPNPNQPTLPHIDDSVTETSDSTSTTKTCSSPPPSTTTTTTTTTTTPATVDNTVVVEIISSDDNSNTCDNYAASVDTCMVDSEQYELMVVEDDSQCAIEIVDDSQSHDASSFQCDDDNDNNDNSIVLRQESDDTFVVMMGEVDPQPIMVDIVTDEFVIELSSDSVVATTAPESAKREPLHPKRSPIGILSEHPNDSPLGRRSDVMSPDARSQNSTISEIDYVFGFDGERVITNNDAEMISSTPTSIPISELAQRAAATKPRERAVRRSTTKTRSRADNASLSVQLAMKQLVLLGEKHTSGTDESDDDAADNIAAQANGDDVVVDPTPDMSSLRISQSKALGAQTSTPKINKTHKNTDSAKSVQREKNKPSDRHSTEKKRSSHGHREKLALPPTKNDNNDHSETIEPSVDSSKRMEIEAAVDILMAESIPEFKLTDVLKCSESPNHTSSKPNGVCVDKSPAVVAAKVKDAEPTTASKSSSDHHRRSKHKSSRTSSSSDHRDKSAHKRHSKEREHSHKHANSTKNKTPNADTKPASSRTSKSADNDGASDGTRKNTPSPVVEAKKPQPLQPSPSPATTPAANGSDATSKSAPSPSVEPLKKPPSTAAASIASPVTNGTSSSISCSSSGIDAFKRTKRINRTKSIFSPSNTLAAKKMAPKPLDPYAILSDCYMPKQVKHDVSLYSIEATRAAKAEADAAAFAAVAAAAAAAVAVASAAAAAAAAAAATAVAAETPAANTTAVSMTSTVSNTSTTSEALSAGEKDTHHQPPTFASKAALKSFNHADDSFNTTNTSIPPASPNYDSDTDAIASVGTAAESKSESKPKLETDDVQPNEPPSLCNIAVTPKTSEMLIKTESQSDEASIKTENQNSDDTIKNELTITAVDTDVGLAVGSDEATIADSANSPADTSTDSTSATAAAADDESNIIRRSGRIKIISETKQRSRGFGLVRDRDRIHTTMTGGIQLSSDATNTELIPSAVADPNWPHGADASAATKTQMPADIGGNTTHASNTTTADAAAAAATAVMTSMPWLTQKDEIEQQQRDVREGLSLFKQIVNNEFLSERNVSKEAKRMTCDCFLTAAEVARGEYGCGEDCLNRLLMIECGTRCVVGDRCTNKRFQRHQTSACTIVKTGKKGFGLMASAPMAAGDFIMEYVGEVLNSAQFEKRAADYSNDKNRHHYFMALRSDCVIDATIKGNISRFINHSCDPNAETQKWTVNGELRIGFFASKSIAAGEEVTFDYQFQRYGKAAQRCYCEAECCRGWIGEQPDSDEEVDTEEDDDDDDVDDEDENADADATMDDATVSRNKLPDQSLAIDADGDVQTTNDEQLSLADKKKHPESIVRRPRGRPKKLKSKPKRAEIMDDPDLDMHIDTLMRSQLKNQAQTLLFCRLMMRAKLRLAKSQLLRILRAGELSCRRLFLDYHGLKWLHAWMSDPQHTIEWDFLLEILQTLAVLPILNKLLLEDSKVLHTVGEWSRLEATAMATATATATAATTADNVSEPDAKLPCDIPKLLEENSLIPDIGLDALKQIISTNEMNETKKQQADMGMEVDAAVQEHEVGREVGDSAVTAADADMMESTTTSAADETPVVPSTLPEAVVAEKVAVAEVAPATTTPTTTHTAPATDPSVMKAIVELAKSLLAKWATLPEAFRIPKKQRIEQMKEHEREANLNYRALGAVDTEEENLRQRNVERFREREQRVLVDPRPVAPGFLPRANVGPMEPSVHMTKLQRRQLFEAKMANMEKLAAERRLAEQQRIHLTKCVFFGLNAVLADETAIPFCVDPNNLLWRNRFGHLLYTPPSMVHIQPVVPAKSPAASPDDYEKPTVDLPKGWSSEIDDRGLLYFINKKTRIAQWEPPAIEAPPQPDKVPDANRIAATVNDMPRMMADSSSDSESEDIEEDLLAKIKEHSEAAEAQRKILSNMTLKPLNLMAEISAMAQPIDEMPANADGTPSGAEASTVLTVGSSKRRKCRKSLVQEFIINPLSDEDRKQFKLEMRRYRSNKEKQRQNRRRDRRTAVVVSTDPDSSRRTLSSTSSGRAKNIVCGGGDSAVATNRTARNDDDEEDDDDAAEDDCDDEDGVDDGIESNATEARMRDESDSDDDDGMSAGRYERLKDVDELSMGAMIVADRRKRNLAADASDVIKNRGMKRAKFTRDETASPQGQPHPHQPSLPAAASSSSASAMANEKQIKDKFRSNISGVIVMTLSSYRRDNCPVGHITNDDDFRYLAKKLTNFVMLKEQKYTKYVIEMLEVTDSVRMKAKDFVRKYMRKFGPTYTRSETDL